MFELSLLVMAIITLHTIWGLVGCSVLLLVARDRRSGGADASYRSALSALAKSRIRVADGDGCWPAWSALILSGWGRLRVPAASTMLGLNIAISAGDNAGSAGAASLKIGDSVLTYWLISVVKSAGERSRCGWQPSSSWR